MTIFQNALALVIAGPTASGKSRLALELAQAYSGVVINADSIQLYQELPVLSAQPGPDDLQKAKHCLYGVMAGEKSCTAALWCEMVLEVLEECRENKALPIIVGGTGFYLKALMEGLSPIPPVPQDIRENAIKRCREVGLKNFYKEISAFDPDMAKRLKIQDQQRLIRTWEVYHATGKSLSSWQAHPKIKHASMYHFVTLYLDPPREGLIKKADSRLDDMVRQGALTEVRALLDKKIARTTSVFKALGAQQLADYLEGLIPLDVALKKAKKLTHSYIKRQQTWFRHQLTTPHRINDFYSKDTFRYAQSVLKEFDY